MVRYRYSIGDKVWCDNFGEAIIVEYSSSEVLGPCYYVKSINSNERRYITEREIMVSYANKPEKNEIKDDMVNHPAHYAQNGENECIEVMRWLFGDEAVKAYCRCNIFKYRFRCGMKNGEEDIDKSVWYENYLHGMLKEQERSDD